MTVSCALLISDVEDRTRWPRFMTILLPRFRCLLLLFRFFTSETSAAEIILDRFFFLEKFGFVPADGEALSDNNSYGSLSNLLSRRDVAKNLILIDFFFFFLSGKWTLIAYAESSVSQVKRIGGIVQSGILLTRKFFNGRRPGADRKILIPKTLYHVRMTCLFATHVFLRLSHLKLLSKYFQTVGSFIGFKRAFKQTPSRSSNLFFLLFG